jgi:phosphatidylserine/phosphatidylglycerophosphate/cardiolipin synthase-like enzyme
VRPFARAARSHAHIAAAFLVLAAAGCDRLDHDRRDRPSVDRPSVEREPHEGAPDALPDHTSAPSRDAPTSPSLDGAIRVSFSQCYDNDPEIGRSDTANIDRAVESFISGARSTLDCAFFELESARVADALIAAHRRGVRVRMVGESDHRANAEAMRVAAAGIPVIWDERSALMHNKFLVADGEAVWTGSYNVTDNCSFRNNNNAVVIRSRELAENYRTEFEEMFVDRRFGPRSPSNTPHTLVTVDGASIYNYFSPEDEIPPKLIRFVRAAKKSIHVLAFSFTDDELAQEIVTRHAAGIDARVVLEKRGSGGRGSVLALLRAGGVDVTTDANSFVMHHKVIIVDSTWTITGSYNFSAAAARSNDENVLIIKSPAIARQYEAEFSRIRAMSTVAGGL